MSTKTKQQEKNAIVTAGFVQFSKIDPDAVAINFQPLNVRNDCSNIGEWKIGEKKKIGDKLEMAILAVRTYYGKLGKSTNKWLQIFFIPAPHDSSILPKGIVCVTYIKTQSLSELTAELTITPNPELGIWETSFVAKENDKGKYHYVSFICRPRNEDEKPQLAAIAKFLKEEGHRLYDPSLPPTMIPYIWNDEESLKEAKSIASSAIEAETNEAEATAKA